MCWVYVSDYQYIGHERQGALATGAYDSAHADIMMPSERNHLAHYFLHK